MQNAQNEIMVFVIDIWAVLDLLPLVTLIKYIDFRVF